MACSASREAEAGRVSASRAGGHAPRTGERVARKSASRACFCVTDWQFPRVFFSLRAKVVPLVVRSRPLLGVPAALLQLRVGKANGPRVPRKAGRQSRRRRCRRRCRDPQLGRRPPRASKGVGFFRRPRPRRNRGADCPAPAARQTSRGRGHRLSTHRRPSSQGLDRPRARDAWITASLGCRLV